MLSPSESVDSKRTRDKSKSEEFECEDQVRINDNPLFKMLKLATKKSDNDKSGGGGSSKSKSSLLLISSYFYIPILLIAGSVQYFGGVNEAMVAAMSFTYRHYGLFHGGPAVYADTEYGKLKGFTSVSREGKTFYEFLGIPFATPPLGNLRFKPPIAPSKWEGVKDATGYGHMCVQYDLFLQAVMGNEDCLALNIYTPKLNSTDGILLPVVIFIHGGMYHFGRASDFRGHHFIDEDIVVVTINYRLQALGFLNTGDGVVMGNMGLKDQVIGMKFVQENIHNFGGDKNLVTIWGESAGGASAQLHTLSPMSKGLFHRAISNSGFSLAHWSFIRKPKEQAKRFAKVLNCPTESSHEMVECLRQVSVRRIAEVFRGNHDVLHPRLDVFAPTVESGFPDENYTDIFLPGHPRELLRSGKIINKVPMLMGDNSHEGLIYAGYFVRNQTVADHLNRDWNRHAPVLLDYEDLPVTERNKVSAELWNFYLGNKSVGMESLYEIVDMFSDTSFNKPMDETAMSFSKVLPLYLYIYNHQGEFGVAQAYFRVSLKFPILVEGLFATGLQWFNKVVLGITEHHWGSCHADEMAMFFKMHPLLSTINPGHPEFSFSRALVKNWAHFARTGKPLDFQRHEWPKVELGKPLKYMLLDSAKSPGMIEAPWKNRLKFLSSLPGFQCIQEYQKNNHTSICF